MSVAPAMGDERANEEGQLIAALIARCRLTAETVQHIFEAMATSKLGFGRTALTLGLITSEQLREIEEELATPASGQGSSLIALSAYRFTGTREIALRHDEQVTPGKALTIAHDPTHPRSEKIRALRTELLLLNDTGPEANALAIVSPQPGEGRSQLAAELAISFAQLGRQTLLVDADLRKPRQHELFGAENWLGLAQLLKYGGSGHMLGVHGLPSMSLLLAGTVPSDPLELLSDGRFERLTAKWRRSYDYIIVDTPPVAQYSDGIIVATIARRMLVVGRAKTTSRNNLKEMLRRLQPTQCRILGAIINYL
jgi:protein-tyrosine kinase